MMHGPITFRFPTGATDFSPLRTVRMLLGHNQPPIQHASGFFPGGGGVKQPGRDIDHLPSSSADVKTKCSWALKHAFNACRGSTLPLTCVFY